MRTISRLFARFAIAAILVCVGTVPSFGAQSDAVKLRDKVKAEYTRNKGTAQADTWAKSLRADGTWADIDYTDRSPSQWQTAKHLDRVIAIGRRGNDPKAAERAMQHWFDAGYRNDNWWYEKIGVPGQMLEIAYLLDDSMSLDLRRSIDKALDAIDPDDYPARPGGDRIQVLGDYCKAMLWRGNLDKIDEGVRLIESEARYAPDETSMFNPNGTPENRIGQRPAGRGFQSDMTFHHRGDRVDNTLTYGMVVYNQYTYWDKLLRGTAYEFGAESRAFMQRFLDEAVRWHLVRDTYPEPGAYNRELARKHGAVKKYNYSEKAAPVGARYFPQSGYFAFKRPTYETAVRFHSWRNANQEYPHNNEGIRNHFRGDGACHLSVSGTEYLNIWPIFDFRKVPGVTSPLVDYASMPAMDVQLQQSPIQFAGAVCDSIYGACAVDFATTRSDLKARKSWFFFDKGYVCLGSGISCSATDTIVTTIEQCRSTKNGYTRQGDRYIHGHNAYKIITGKASATNEMKQGTWANCVTGNALSREKAQGYVFTLTINHGTKPKNAKYAYAVVPDTDGDIPDDWFTIVRHDNSVHAVASADGEILYIAFFEAGTVKHKGRTVTVDRPCMVMMHDDETYVSDPTHRLDSVKVTIGRNGKKTTHRVAFATGKDAGRSVHLR